MEPEGCSLRLSQVCGDACLCSHCVPCCAALRRRAMLLSRNVMSPLPWTCCLDGLGLGWCPRPQEEVAEPVPQLGFLQPGGSCHRHQHLPSGWEDCGRIFRTESFEVWKGQEAHSSWEHPRVSCSAYGLRPVQVCFFSLVSRVLCLGFSFRPRRAAGRPKGLFFPLNVFFVLITKSF